MKLLLLPALAALLLASLPLRATPLDDRISELKHAVQKEAAARTNGAGNNLQFGNQVVMNPAFVDASIDQILAQMENPAYGNMDAQLAQITSMYTSTEVQEATTNLLNEIKKERKDKVDAEITAVKALLARAGAAITQAKKPEDLDDLVAELGSHANNQYGGNSALQGDQKLLRRLTSANEFVKQWQDYLAHMADGQTDQARNDLQALSNNNGGEGLLPRSKLLELEAPSRLVAPASAASGPVSTPEAQAQAILDDIKSLDDIKAALPKLAPLENGDIMDIRAAYTLLEQMMQSYDELKVGMPARVTVEANSQGFTSVIVPAALRSQLVLLSLQSRFDTYKGTPPAPGERPAEFADRVIADAIAREDWPLLENADSVRRNLTQNGDVGSTVINFDGIDRLVAAAHLEAAGQFKLAVRSYEEALQSDNPDIPAKIIGDKLAAIQHDHPKEFDDGMQLVAPAPAVPRYFPGRVPGQPYSFPPPGFSAPSAPSRTATNAAPAPAAAPSK